jgi:hypothetical protein
MLSRAPEQVLDCVLLIKKVAALVFLFAARSPNGVQPWPRSMRLPVNGMICGDKESTFCFKYVPH